MQLQRVASELRHDETKTDGSVASSYVELLQAERDGTGPVGSLRLPLRAKSSAISQRGTSTVLPAPRTGAHRGPHTESINRS